MYAAHSLDVSNKVNQAVPAYKPAEPTMFNPDAPSFRPAVTTFNPQAEMLSPAPVTFTTSGATFVPPGAIYVPEGAALIPTAPTFSQSYPFLLQQVGYEGGFGPPNGEEIDAQEEMANRELSVVHVGLLPNEVTEESVRSYFRKHGLDPVKVLHVVDGNYAFVHCGSELNARSAVSTLNGKKFWGSRIRVELSRIYMRIPDIRDFWDLDYGRAARSKKNEFRRTGMRFFGRPEVGRNPWKYYWSSVPQQMTYCPAQNEYTLEHPEIVVLCPYDCQQCCPVCSLQ